MATDPMRAEDDVTRHDATRCGECGGKLADSACEDCGTRHGSLAEVFIQRRYRCPSCRKSWSSRTRADRHIADGCHRDLSVRACSTCKHDNRGENDYPPSPAGCDLGVRPEHEHIIRNCEKWEAKRWLLSA